MIPVSLVALAALQLLYIIWLAYGPSRRRTARQPDSPVMPTDPDSEYSTQQPVPTGDGQLGKPSVGKVVVLSGVRNLTEIPLPSSNFGIGRFYSTDSNILVALDERSISRRHATFVGDEATREYYLTDTNSSYGTRIRIGNQFVPLMPGREERLYNEDVVQFGNVVTVRFLLPCESRPAGTRPA